MSINPQPHEMEIPDKIRRAAERLKMGHRVNRITVRDFIGHFGAERRGAAKVESMREILDFLDLKTEPDFETAWIDEPIWLKLKDGSQLTEDASLTSDELRAEQENTNVEEIILDSSPSAI